MSRTQVVGSIRHRNGIDLNELGSSEARGRSAEISREDLESLLERVRPSLPEEDFQKLRAVIEGLELLTELIADKDTTNRDLRRLLFPLVTEKTREVLEPAGLEENRSPRQTIRGSRRSRDTGAREPIFTVAPREWKCRTGS